MIELGPASPTPQRPYADPPAVELLPHGIGLFELRRDAFTFRYGNREFARVLRLERVPDQGLTLGEIFNRAEHDAIVELFQMVRVSGEPQSYFAAEGHEGSTNEIWNIDAYPGLAAGAVRHGMVLAERQIGR